MKKFLIWSIVTVILVLLFVHFRGKYFNNVHNTNTFFTLDKLF